MLKNRAAENEPLEHDDTDVFTYNSMVNVAAQDQIVRDIPVDKFKDFFTADIGFRPQTGNEFCALTESIKENGLLEDVIARPIPDSDFFEIIAGKHRVEVHRVLQKATVRTKVLNVSDARAVLIATETNLKRRQTISAIEKGYAYKTQLDVLKQQGKKIVLPDDESILYDDKKLTSRKRVAFLNGVDENEVWRYIRLTYLIAPFRELMMRVNSKFPDNVGIKLSFYDDTTQEIIYRLCMEEKIHSLDMKTAEHLREECPIPSATEDSISAALQKLNNNKKPATISFKFTKTRFKPYMEKMKSPEDLENLILELLEARFGVLN